MLDCPGGTFIGAGVKTVVLFFEKGAPTRKVWFYQLDPGRNMGKTNPLNDADLAEFIALQKTKADSPKSCSVDVAAIAPKTFDLSVKNPQRRRGIAHRGPRSDPLGDAAHHRHRKTSRSRGIGSRIMTKAKAHHLARLDERKQAALEALKKSLLHQAFTGELRKPLAMSRIITNVDGRVAA